MIYVIVILFALFAPFFGVFGMEMGAYSLTSSEYGYRVGATEAYLMYIVIIILTIFVAKNSKVIEKNINKLSVVTNTDLYSVGSVRVELVILAILSILLAYHNLILAGGLKVVEGIQ